MLYIVLLLVLAALGLLVPALTSGQTYWAWLSVGASGAAAVVLVLDWWLRRRSSTPAAGTTAVDHRSAAVDDRSEPQQPVATPSSPAIDAETDVEPGEEDTDAADSLIVSELTDEVRVVDERPRYHLSSCAWVGSRTSLGLPIDEARRLGFTPCATCRPDSTLAAARRADP